jgi:hypothetical protein
MFRTKVLLLPKFMARYAARTEHKSTMTLQRPELGFQNGRSHSASSGSTTWVDGWSFNCDPGNLSFNGWLEQFVIMCLQVQQTKHINHDQWVDT